MSKVLTRDDVLDADDLEKLLVKDVPVWGGDIWIRMMSSGERMKFETAMLNSDGELDVSKIGDLHARIVALTAIEVDGSRMFPNPNDVSLVSEKNYAPVQYVAQKALEFNKIDEKSQEEAAKN